MLLQPLFVGGVLRQPFFHAKHSVAVLFLRESALFERGIKRVHPSIPAKLISLAVHLLSNTRPRHRTVGSLEASNRIPELLVQALAPATRPLLSEHVPPSEDTLLACELVAQFAVLRNLCEVDAKVGDRLSQRIVILFRPQHLIFTVLIAALISHVSFRPFRLGSQ
jgi:hypothetical protein